MDVRERVLLRDGQPVPLTPKAFDLLAALLDRPGRLITKDELLETVWPDTFVEEANLAYHVFALRKALGDTATGATYIETVPKRGYRFTAPVFHSPGTFEPGAPVAPAPSALGWAMPRIRWVALAFGLVVVLSAATRVWRPAGVDPPRERPLTSLPGVVQSPSLSPDGSYVAFAWRRPDESGFDLFIQQVGVGSPLQLTIHPGDDVSPAWSPDGRAIAFFRRTESGAYGELWTIAPLGGGERKVADVAPRLGGFRAPVPTWCPDSKCVLVTDSPGADQADAIFAVAVDTGEKRQVTFPQGRVRDTDAAISPDGRRLIFRRDTTPFSGEFFGVPLKAGVVPDGELVRLTSTISAGRAAWLSDSRHVLFAARARLWKLDAVEGGTPMRLPFVGQDGQTPDLVRTMDGRHRLVYVHSFADTNVWRVDRSAPIAEGLPPATAAIRSTRTDTLATLSPDRSRLAFLSDRSGEPHIWIAGIDGAGAFQLTSLAFASGPGFPRWSPDGQLIAFHADPLGRPDVLVAPAGGGPTRNLTENGPGGAYPSFSRNGQWIYFSSAPVIGRFRIWKMPVSGGEAVPVTDDPGALAIESHDGRDLYYVDVVDRPGTLWRLSLSGGSPVEIVRGVVSGSFDVVENGIYYIDYAPTQAGESPGNPSGRQTRLQYLDFATGRSTTIADQLGRVTFGLSASPDGRQVFFSRVDSAIDELMIVDDFR